MVPFRHLNHGQSDIQLVQNAGEVSIIEDIPRIEQDRIHPKHIGFT